jgi:beta-phosphoglucomutase-like phosphatase (HAD superfamily)
VADLSKPVLTAAQLEQWVDQEKRAVIAYLRNVLRPDPEVGEPLSRLSERYGLAVVSSSADERVAASCEVSGLAHFFPPDRRFSAEDSLPRPTSKPDPAIYRFAGEQLGLELDEGVAVEDSLPGATSAIAAGFPTIGNLQYVPAMEQAARRQALEEVGAVAVVGSWREVVELLDPDLTSAGHPGT